MNDHDPNIAARQRWMGVLARATRSLCETARKALMVFLGSEGDGAVLASDHVKQYTAPLEAGVENWAEMAAYLEKTRQMDLMPTR